MLNIISCETTYEDFKTDKESIKNFLISNNISDFKFCSQQDVRDNKSDKFILICTMSYYLSAFVSQMNIIPLSQDIKYLTKECENFYIVMINESEADVSTILQVFENKLKEENLNPKQFHVCTGNESLPNIKSTYNNDINVFVSDKLTRGYSYQLSSFQYDIKDEKKYLFSCFNRRFHKHRFAILCYLKKYNVLDDTNWSFLRGEDYKKRFKYDFNYLNEVMNAQEMIDEINYVGNIGLKKADFEQNYNLDINEYELDYFLGFKLNALSESYINITTESKFVIDDVIHITEKTLFPFYFFQIPIFVSSYNHVKKVREKLGLDLFDDLVNHDYDFEKNNKKRMIMIANEIDRLNQNKTNIIEFYKKNKQRLLNNRDIILDLKNKNHVSDYLNLEFT